MKWQLVSKAVGKGVIFPWRRAQDAFIHVGFSCPAYLVHPFEHLLKKGEFPMTTKSAIKTVRNDMKTLVKDAQELFREAAAATGDKADELRSKGLTMLEAAVEAAQNAQAVAIEKGKEVAARTDDYVHENPWRAVAISAGVGLLVGLVIGRSK